MKNLLPYRAFIIVLICFTIRVEAGIGEGISNTGSLTSIITHTVGEGISNTGTLSSIPTYRIALNNTDLFVELKSIVAIQGTLTNPQGQPISNAVIAVNDALKGFSTFIQTDQNGNFTYNSTAKRIGVYQIYFDYSLGNVELAANNALVDVGNEAIIALFKKVKYFNNSDQSVTVNLKYEGLNSLTNPQSVTYDKDFVVPPFTTVVLVETEDFNFKPELIDRSSEQGPPPSTGWFSIGRTLCPVQLGVVTICGPDPEDPNAQLFTLSVDLGLSFGLYYDNQNLDFGVSVGAGVNVPYMINGSGALTFGSDGLGLEVEGGVGMSKWTVKVFDSETNSGMNGITGVIHSPVDPLFIDPQGRRIGIDPISNTFVNEIPYASYTGPSSEPQVIHIPNPVNGNWDITTIGREEGPYTIEKNRYFYNVIDQQIINGNSVIDSIINFQIIIDTTQTTILPPDNTNVSLVDTTLLVNWSAVTNALYYNIYYDNDTSGIPYYGTSATQGSSPITISNSEQITLTGLDDGKIYYISITAVDSQGVQSYFSIEDSCLFNPTTPVDELQSKLIAEYSLHQNYPNPFNPSTKIQFTIPSNVKPQRSNVVLKVYDVLGNEVATLVNEEKSAGNYEVEFSISGIGNLASGIYFYQLKAGSYIHTKKMILIK